MEQRPRYLADLAQKIERPLITCEQKLTKRARESGVTVYSPREFWEDRGLDAVLASQKFLRRFKASIGAFTQGRDGAKEWRYGLDQLFDWYRYLLLGRR